MNKLLASIVFLFFITPVFADDAVQLMHRYEALNDKCRGGSGDDPNTTRACDAREALLPKIEGVVCFTHDGGGEESSYICSNPPHPQWCRNASTTVEHAICNDVNLSVLDVYSSAGFRQNLRRASDPSTVLLVQRQWLRKRNACKTKKCLIEAYLHYGNPY